MSERRLVTDVKRDCRHTHHIAVPICANVSHDRDAFDIAFENFSRVDVGTTAKLEATVLATSQAANATKSLVADVTAQLAALDCQRQRLSGLLRNAIV